MSVIINDSPFTVSYMNFDASEYNSILQKKIGDVKSKFLLKRYISTPTIDNCTVIPSPTKFFRQRCRFAVRLDIDSTDSGSSSCDSSRLQYFMWEGGYPIVRVDDFPIASIQIFKMMPVLLTFITPYSILSGGLKAIHFLSSSIGHIVCTLIYEQKIAEIDWLPAATLLRDYLRAAEITCVDAEHISIIGRSKGVVYVCMLCIYVCMDIYTVYVCRMCK